MNPLVGDYEQCWNVLNREALNKVGALVDFDSVQPERVVVSSPLQNLSEKPLDSPRATARA